MEQMSELHVHKQKVDDLSSVDDWVTLSLATVLSSGCYNYRLAIIVCDIA